MSFIKESEHLSIPFRDIQVATQNFTKHIGKGGYGMVYEGKLIISGKLTDVAVKRLDNNISGQGFKEFLTEIQLLSRYKHPNLVSLLGFCDEGDEKILIYELAKHGSLDQYLNKANTKCVLTWKQRINICIDAARGLDYLHNHVAKNHRVIHRDIKSSNILLDRNWTAMISDFGLSKIGRANENDTYLITNASGTHGYCDPVYMHTGILTKASDVYSFGVVLFEVLCGRLCFINVHNERRFLAPLAQRYYKNGKLNDIIDPCLKNQMDSESLNSISAIAYQCLHNDRERRPLMGLVVRKLKEALELQERGEAFELQKLEEALGLRELVLTLGLQEIDKSSTDYEEINRIFSSSMAYTSKEEQHPHLYKGNLIDRCTMDGKKKYVKQVTGRHNETELHLAAARGDLTAVKQIFDEIRSNMGGILSGAGLEAEFAEIRASVVNEVNELGETALYRAAERGHFEIVKELLKYSDEETVMRKSRLDFDAFHIAASQGHHAIVQLLLDHDVPPYQVRFPGNETPLFTAALKGHTAVFHLLLSRDPRLLDIARSDGKNAMHIAANLGHVEILKTMLDKFPHQARRTDKKGQTALHMAAKGVSIEVVKLLVEADPNIVMLPDKFGFTALHVATRKKRVEIVNELLCLPISNVNALTRDHKTALDIAEELPLSENSTNIRACLVRYGAVRAKELNQLREE